MKKIVADPTRLHLAIQTYLHLRFYDNSLCAVFVFCYAQKN